MAVHVQVAAYDEAVRVLKRLGRPRAARRRLHIRDEALIVLEDQRVSAREQPGQRLRQEHLQKQRERERGGEAERAVFAQGVRAQVPRLLRLAGRADAALYERAVY